MVRCVVEAREAPALILLADRIKRVLLPHDFRREILGILHRPVAERRATGRRPVTSRIVRYAPCSDEADIRRLDAAIDELDEVFEAEPGAQVAKFGRPLECTADPHADALDAVLVPVEAGQPLAPHFAQTVQTVGAKVTIQGEPFSRLMHAYRMVRAGE